MITGLSIFVSVLLVSFVSFAGLFVLSLKAERLALAFTFLIPLAIGALFGDAFFHLIPKAFAKTENPELMSLFLILGVILFFLIERFLRWHHHSVEETIPDHPQDPKHLGRLILISDGFHNFLDGIIIGVAYLAGFEIGVATTIAIILHEIPQEVGDFSILLYSGYQRTTALFYNFLSALTAVAGAAVVVLAGSLPDSLTNGMIPLAAGIFIYIAGSDLVPELHKQRSSKAMIAEICGIGVGALAMYLLLFLE